MSYQVFIYHYAWFYQHIVDWFFQRYCAEIQIFKSQTHLLNLHWKLQLLITFSFSTNIHDLLTFLWQIIINVIEVPNKTQLMHSPPPPPKTKNVNYFRNYHKSATEQVLNVEAPVITVIASNPWPKVFKSVYVPLRKQIKITSDKTPLSLRSKVA